MILVINALIGLFITALIFRQIQRGRAQAQQEHVDRRALNAAIYQERLAELEQERAREQLTDEVFEQLKRELQSTLLIDAKQPSESASSDPSAQSQDSSSAPSNPSSSNTNSPHSQAEFKSQYLLTLLILPFAMMLIYVVMSYNDELKTWESAKADVTPVIERILAGENVPSETLKKYQISVFVRVLQDYMHKNPEKTQGWAMLAGIFKENKMTEPAYQAARKAYELDSENLEKVALYADLIIVKNQGRLTAESETVLNQYLVKEVHPSLLAMKASAAFRAEKLKTAIATWEQLLAMSDAQMKNGTAAGQPGAQKGRRQLEAGRRFLQQSIAMARQKLSGEEAAVDGVAGNPRASTSSLASSSPDAASGVVYHLKVDLEGSLQSQWNDFLSSNPQAMLFLFIKATQGPPMPLAVKTVRFTPDQKQPFPMSFTLSQADSMLPNLKLKDFKEVNIIARLSQRGHAKAEAGDWQGELKQVSQAAAGSDDQPLVITINQIEK